MNKKAAARGLLLIVIVVLASCRGGNRVSRTDAGDTLRMKYASLLTIVDHEGYTEVIIGNPWKAGKTLHRYYLVPRDSIQMSPDGRPEGSIVRIPIARASVFTTVHCSLLTRLGMGDRIVGVADLKYIKIPYIHERVKAGKIVDCGNGLNPVVEAIMQQKPDMIMLSPFENSGGYGKLEELGIPLIECAEYMETSPLGRAEWMRFYGRLFGCGAKADSLFAVVDSSYQQLRQRAAQAGEGRWLLIDKMVGSVWYVPGGKSTIGQMVNDAGGRYPWADDTHSGSLPLPFETVLEKGGEADVWMFRYASDREMTRRQLMSEHHGYDHLKAVRAGAVYGCNVSKTLFYEESPFRPDWLLSDFIQILHPEITNLPPLRYYNKL